MFYYFTYDSPVGKLMVVSDEDNIVGLWIEGQKYFMENIKGKMVENPNYPILKLVKKWLDDYFNGQKPELNLPLKPYGSQFKRTVWQVLCEIPYGKTVTYGSVANKVASKLGKERMSARAIGNAVGHNPISIIIPCHRVVGKNGNLTGYAGGLDKKIWLLNYENALVKKQK